MDTEDELRKPPGGEQDRQRGVRNTNGSPTLSIGPLTTHAAIAGDARMHERLQAGG